MRLHGAQGVTQSSHVRLPSRESKLNNRFILAGIADAREPEVQEFLLPESYFGDFVRPENGALKQLDAQQRGNPQPELSGRLDSLGDPVGRKRQASSAFAICAKRKLNFVQTLTVDPHPLSRILRFPEKAGTTVVEYSSLPIEDLAPTPAFVTDLASRSANGMVVPG
jgi:hypothetical protein